MIRVAIVFICGLLIAGPVLSNTPPEVTNVIGVQRPHTALIDVTYDISDVDGDAVFVSLWYSVDGGVSWDQECLTVSGDVGPGIVPSAGLSATWDAGVDFPNFINNEFSIRVYADDGLTVECSINMTTPQGGESWYTGDTINIRWDHTTGDNVKIELYKGVDLAGNISASTPNDGFYPWINCSTFGEESGEDYSIKVTHLQDSNCSDQSGPFELIDISNCFIHFPWSQNDPIPDLVAGNIFEITWTSGHTTGAVDLELWYEPFAGQGDIVGIIAENLVDSGSYIWTVDSFHRGTDEGYRLKIKDASVPNCNDRSVPFRITDEENCSIDVLGISDGAIYSEGQVIPISFSFENSNGVVDLRLYSGNLPVAGGMIANNFDTQNGTITYNWTVTDFGHPGPAFDRFNIRAWDSFDEYCVGISSEFSIAQ